MAIPTTDVSLDDIWTEAGNTSSQEMEFGTFARISYFEGNGGSGTYSYNGYGQFGTTSGADRIYPLSAASTDINVNDYKGLVYFYDGGTYQCVVNFTNNLSVPVFPTPPSANDFNVSIELYDSTDTYQYMFGSFGAPAQASGGQNIEQASITPLIGIAYWRITINSDPQGGGGTTTLDINGSNFVNTGSPSFGGQLVIDFLTYGSANMNSSGFTFDLNFS